MQLIHTQLKRGRHNRTNAEKREKYWRNKFEKESIDMEDDNNDLIAIMNLADRKDIPPDIISLWNNQQKVLN